MWSTHAHNGTHVLRHALTSTKTRTQAREHNYTKRTRSNEPSFPKREMRERENEANLPHPFDLPPSFPGQQISHNPALPDQIHFLRRTEKRAGDEGTQTAGGSCSLFTALYALHLTHPPIHQAAPTSSSRSRSDTPIGLRRTKKANQPIGTDHRRRALRHASLLHEVVSTSKRAVVSPNEVLLTNSLITFASMPSPA